MKRKKNKESDNSLMVIFEGGSVALLTNVEHIYDEKKRDLLRKDEDEDEEEEELDS